VTFFIAIAAWPTLWGQDAARSVDTATTIDSIGDLQTAAVTTGKAAWGYWGSNPETYSNWNNHSNRLIPIYTFGITLDALRGEGSAYASEDRLRQLYGRVPDETLNPDAQYLDQTDVYRLQLQAIAEGKKNVVLVIFDGTDWQTTRLAALYHSGTVAYTEGRGTGLVLQDYRGAETDFGFFVTAPLLGDVVYDVDAQRVIDGMRPATGGYDPKRGGRYPWSSPPSRDYLMGLDRSMPHTVTDSASSATSMTAGIKTYNAAINVDAQGNRVETIAHQLQRDRGMAIGVVTSVPISHATPAAAYAHNVTRKDYQDLARDLIGLPSVSHRTDPMPGVDVLIGGGWGVAKSEDVGQGANFIPGGEFYDPGDLDRVSVERGGRYVVAQRTAGQRGSDVLAQGARRAITGSGRLIGVFGGPGGHLPYATANGDYRPTIDAQGQLAYSDADIVENPTLAEMATTAMDVLATRPEGFWLMVEAGDVDWANHSNNIDHSIGATLSGDAAVAAIFRWIESRDAWDETAVIVTADHGHHLVLTDPETIAQAGRIDRRDASRGQKSGSP
jgi:alkaline phosphatase